MRPIKEGQFRVTSNRESGFGRYDVSLEPSDPQRSPFAFLLEFKVFDEKEGDSSIEDTARRARRQIEDRRYDADLTAKGFAPGRIRYDLFVDFAQAAFSEAFCSSYSS